MKRWLEEQAHRIRRGERAAAPLDAVLALGTPLVRWGMRRRLAQPRVRLDARVISFGNITAGGAGKTPAVIERAQMEIAIGRKVAVISRGYGSASGPKPAALSPGEYTAGDLFNLAESVGDELALIGYRARQAFLIKNSNRVAAATLATETYGCDTLILDDGFQQPVLERGENILVVDAVHPFGNEMLLPRGILREPLEAMARATSVILTHCDRVEGAALETLEEQIHRYAPGIPLRRTRHAPAGLWRLCDGAAAPLETLRGAKVTAACAIAQPESFWRTLEELGAILENRLAFRDHHAFAAKALPENAERIVVTEKDAMRLPGAGKNVWALAIALNDLP